MTQDADGFVVNFRFCSTNQAAGGIEIGFMAYSTTQDASSPLTLGRTSE